jgi:hypothetical protein
LKRFAGASKLIGFRACLPHESSMRGAQLDSWSWSQRPATRLAHPTSIAARRQIKAWPHRLGAKTLYSNLRQPLRELRDRAAESSRPF